MILKIAAALILGGAALFLGYMAYTFLAFPLLPLPLKAAIIAIGVGAILLLTAVGWERYKAAKREEFKEVER